MDEPYRTLLGHMRHESGHYYWDRLHPRARPQSSTSFERSSATSAPTTTRRWPRYYQNGAPADWQDQFVSAYATAHPWEDWAETWAHYLHMVDTLETAAACGLSLKPRRADEPTLPATPDPVAAAARHVRAADRQLVPAHLRAEQPESRPRALRRVPLRAVAGGHRQAAVRRRCRGPDETRRSRTGWPAADARSLMSRADAWPGHGFRGKRKSTITNACDLGQEDSRFLDKMPRAVKPLSLGGQGSQFESCHPDQFSRPILTTESARSRCRHRHIRAGRGTSGVAPLVSNHADTCSSSASRQLLNVPGGRSMSRPDAIYWRMAKARERGCCSRSRSFRPLPFSGESKD